jgi:hypothetical protein
MVQPIEQRDVAIDLIKPAPVIMTNLLNLTHTTRIEQMRSPPAKVQLGGPQGLSLLTRGSEALLSAPDCARLYRHISS